MLRADNKIELKKRFKSIFSRQNKMHYNSFWIHYYGFYNK